MKNQKQLFKKHILCHFQGYQKRNNGETNTPEQLLEYLLIHNLIPNTIQRRYVVLQEFQACYAQHHYHKTNTVIQLAIDLGVHENTIWTILKDHSRDFESGRR